MINHCYHFIFRLVVKLRCFPYDFCRKLKFSILLFLYLAIYSELSYATYASFGSGGHIHDQYYHQQNLLYSLTPT